MQCSEAVPGSPDVLRGRHVCQVAVGSQEAVGEAGEEPGGDEGGERGGVEKDGQPREQSRHRSPNQHNKYVQNSNI